MDIHVTEEDIARAVPKDSGHCALADAIAREVRGASNVSVDLATVRWTDRQKGERYTYLTPRSGQLLLINFDQGDRNRCQPTTVRLAAPVQVSPIKSSSAPKRRATAESVAAKRTAIEAKQAAGETLTSDDKRFLSRSAKPRVERPSSPGPVVMESSASTEPDERRRDPAGGLRKRGGAPAPLAVLAHGHGRRRVFGIKNAGMP